MWGERGRLDLSGQASARGISITLAKECQGQEISCEEVGLALEGALMA